jgi:hypothetical protein
MDRRDIFNTGKQIIDILFLEQIDCFKRNQKILVGKELENKEGEMARLQS